MYHRILVPTDGSDLSKKAVRSAIEQAAASGAEIVALHVVPRVRVSYFDGGLAPAPANVALQEKNWAERGQAIVDDAQASAASAGIKARGVISRSNLIAEAIIASARKNKCDLIVMASHGRKGLKRILLGSETQHVLTHTTLPVLVLR